MKKATGSIVQGNSRLASSSFKYQEYERPGVSSEEIKEIKEVFDLFDSHRNGFIRPKGTFKFIEICRSLLTRLDQRQQTSPFTT